MKHQTVTSLPAAPADERRNRMLEYTIMMSIRVLCLISLIWVRGWWLVIPAAGAIFLPYFAVVVANAAQTRTRAPERPGAIVRVGDDYYESSAEGVRVDGESVYDPADAHGAQGENAEGEGPDGEGPDGEGTDGDSAPGARPDRAGAATDRPGDVRADEQDSREGRADGVTTAGSAGAEPQTSRERRGGDDAR